MSWLKEQIAIRPQHFTGKVQAGGALVSEVNVDAIATDNGRWARMAVLSVYLWRLRSVLFHHRDGVQQLSR